MSHRTYDRTWRDAMEDLIELSHLDDPLASKTEKDLHGWSVMYLRYLRAFQRLNAASSHIIQAQKRKDLRRCLEGCMARMLEIRAHLVTLNKGMDIMSFEPAMTELNLTPEALDIPVPGFLVQEPPQAELEQIAEARDDSAKENLPANGAENCSSEPLTDAIAKAMTRVAGGQQAATKIQTAARGLLDRMHAARAAEQELLFLNMKRQRPSAGAQKAHRESVKAAENKFVLAQRDADVAYRAALVTEQAEMALLEGPGMREEIQGKINDWLLRARDTNPGELPALPSASEGGSKVLLQEAAAAAAAQNAMPPAATKGPGKGPGKAAPPTAKRGKNAEKAAAVVDDMPRLTCPDLVDAIKRWQEVWEIRPEPELGAWDAVQLDKELLKAEVRPGVFEDIRKQADEETRLLLANLKELADAEAAAMGKPKAAKKDAGGGKAKPAKAAQVPKEQKAASQKAAEARRKDITADRSLASLEEELKEQGLLVETPEVEAEDFLAAYCYAQRGQKPGDIDCEPSLLAIRNRLAELCVLPLLSPYVRTRMPATRALLLYGAPGSGKTMLAHAMAHASGARLFDISPRRVEGKYAGKAVTVMLHMVFKVARETGPSVIYLDEAEKVYAADKRRGEEVEGSEPPSRMRRDLLQEIQALQPAERVIVIGCTSEPYSCTKKDSESLLAAFDKHFYIPLPDYATRQAMWTEALDRCPCPVEDRFDLGSVCLLSEGQSAASIYQIMQSAAARRHGTKQRLKSDDVKDELTQHPAAAALQCVEQLLEWRKSTPVYKAILEGDDDSVTNPAKTASSRKRS